MRDLVKRGKRKRVTRWSAAGRRSPDPGQDTKRDQQVLRLSRKTKDLLKKSGIIALRQQTYLDDVHRERLSWRPP
jgi:hypothetical protein